MKTETYNKLAILISDAMLKHAGFLQTPEELEAMPTCFVKNLGATPLDCQQIAMRKLEDFVAQLDITNVVIARRKLLEFLQLKTDLSHLFSNTSLEVNGNEYSVRLQPAIVLDYKERSDTHVRGAGIVRNGVGDMQVTSNISISSDLWFKLSPSDEEKHVTFSQPLGLRTGHTIHFVYLNGLGNETLCGIYNATTKEWHDYDYLYGINCKPLWRTKLHLNNRSAWWIALIGYLIVLPFSPNWLAALLLIGPFGAFFAWIFTVEQISKRQESKITKHQQQLKANLQEIIPSMIS